MYAHTHTRTHTHTHTCMHCRYPVGHYVRTLGNAGDVDVETEVVLIEHEVPYAPFSDAVHAEMPSLPWTVPPAELARRRDLRELNICSIDPPGERDFATFPLYSHHFQS